MARIELPEIVQTAAGFLRLHPEQADDETFLRRLFDATRPLAAQLAHLPAEMRELVLRGQFQAQSHSLRERYRQGQALIILSGGAPAGRLFFDAAGPAVHIADIALLPGCQGQGIGTALLLALAAAAAPRGLSLEVADDNHPAQRLYARLGFTLAGQTPGYLQLTRPASDSRTLPA
jgi:ribosomal protein S18 acetylase RimI-like enzyme